MNRITNLPFYLLFGLSATVGCMDSAVPTATTNIPLAAAITPIVTCASMAQLIVPNTTIKTASLVVAGSVSTGSPILPEHCLITGIVAPRVGVTNPDTGSNAYGATFQLRLPTSWTGRFLYQGGGGLDGSVPSVASYEADGFAAVSSDGGYEGGPNPFGGGFGLDPQARVDYDGSR